MSEFGKKPPVGCNRKFTAWSPPRLQPSKTLVFPGFSDFDYEDCKLFQFWRGRKSRRWSWCRAPVVAAEKTTHHFFAKLYSLTVFFEEPSVFKASSMTVIRLWSAIIPKFTAWRDGDTPVQSGWLWARDYSLITAKFTAIKNLGLSWLLRLWLWRL